MMFALLFSASLLASQVAVEGERELTAPVVLRLVDDGYRVVPSAEDAMTRLTITREATGDVVLIATNQRSARGRVPAGADALVELEVTQRALLLLAEVGAERDVITDGLPGGISIEVRGARPLLELAELRARTAVELLERGLVLVRSPREGDRIACVTVEETGAWLLLANEAPCPAHNEGSARAPLTDYSALAQLIDMEVAADSTPRRVHEHPFRRPGDEPGMVVLPPRVRSTRLGLALETYSAPFASFGARGDVMVPLGGYLWLLTSGHVGVGPFPVTLLDAELVVGPALEVSPNTRLSLSASLQAGVSAFVLATPHDLRSGAGALVVVPVTLSWRVTPGLAVQIGSSVGWMFATENVVPLRLSALVGLTWGGSGNSRASDG